MSDKRPPHADDPAMTDLDKLVEEVGKQAMTVRQNGHSKTMSTTEAILRKQAATALAGSPHAQRQHLERIAKAEETRRADLASENELWSRLRTRHFREYAEHRQRYGRDPELFPHPKDIESIPGKPVRIDGPLHAVENRQVQRACASVDAYLHQDALDRTQERHRRDMTTTPGNPHWMAILINLTLPARLRWPESKFIERRMELSSLSIRALLKATRVAWKAAGLSVPRRARIPPPADMMRLVEMLVDLGRAASQPGVTPRDADRLVAETWRAHFG